MTGAMLGEHLLINPNTLVFYVDDSGDERLNDCKNPIFAFAGVACVAEHHVPIGCTWQLMKAERFPQVRGPLHANRHLKESRLTEDKRNAVLAAMAHFQLARFGTIITSNTRIDREKVVMIGCGSLTKRLENVAAGMIQLGLWRPLAKPCGCVLVFEHASRLAKKIEQHLPDLTVNIGGTVIPVVGCFMPKAVANPFLEMADFVAYTTAQNIRYQLVHGRAECTANFQALFRDAAPLLASYIEIMDVAE